MIQAEARQMVIEALVNAGWLLRDALGDLEVAKPSWKSDGKGYMRGFPGLPVDRGAHSGPLVFVRVRIRGRGQYHAHLSVGVDSGYAVAPEAVRVVQAYLDKAARAVPDVRDLVDRVLAIANTSNAIKDISK